MNPGLKWRSSSSIGTAGETRSSAWGDKMEKPLVSIITPTYNHERFIGQCIESVLAQTYRHWEMIIVDDGSTDRTCEIIQQYKDSRICYLRQEHKGIYRLGETYNQALNYASGELIAILEGDDYWPPYKLERQIPAFSDNNVTLVWGKGGLVDERGKLIGVLQAVKRNLDLHIPQVISKLVFKNFLFPTVTIVVRRKELLSIGGFFQPSYSPFVDFPTWLRLAFHLDSDKRFYFINDILGYRRKHSSQVSSDLCSMMLAHAKILEEEILKILGAQEKLRQAGISYNTIVSYSGYLRGRIALRNKQWRIARYHFSKAWQKSGFWQKALTCLGLIGSLLKVDMLTLLYNINLNAKTLLWRYGQ